MHYLILLDTSWNIKLHITKLMIGINNLIKCISSEHIDNYVTIATFSDKIKFLHINKISSEIPYISKEDLESNYGDMALYDSIEEILTLFDDTEGEKTLYIVSDGEDRSSSKFTHKQISEQCKICEVSGFWNIVHCSTCVSKLEIRKRYSFNIYNISEIFNTLVVNNRENMS